MWTGTTTIERRVSSFCCGLLAIVASHTGSARAQAQRLVEPSDCVKTRYLNDDVYRGSIKLNAEGTAFAYVLKVPNLSTNQNDLQLFVMSTDENIAALTPHLLLTSNSISQIQWLEDGRHLIALAALDGHVTVIGIDASTGKYEELVHSKADVSEYSINAHGDVLVYATDEAHGAPIVQPTSAEVAAGYRIPFELPTVTRYHRRRLFLTRRSGNTEWSQPELLRIRDSSSTDDDPSFPYLANLRLSLSPDGRKLALAQIVGENVPAAWKISPYVHENVEHGITTMVLTLVDLDTRQASIPLPTPIVYSVPFWSPDSKGFAVVAEAPVNSVWERQAARNHLGFQDATYLFWVEPASGNVEMISAHVANIIEAPLAWSKDGGLLVHTRGPAIARFARTNGEWMQRDEIRVPLTDFFRYSFLASDGEKVVGDYQTTQIPPELFEYTPGGSVKTLVKLNPEFDTLTLATSERVSWQTSTGYPATGMLLLPPGYDRDKAYPLVIQTKAYEGGFLCDTGSSHYPSFAPQPLATTGILYLIRTYAEDFEQKDEIAFYPRGYPGSVAEAAFQMDIWDSAVRTLSARKVIDENNVGIIGFSRSGWYTEFILAHSQVSYKAATVTDNVQYSLAEYTMIHTDDVLRGYEAMYGGGPYGKTLDNWLKYSVSFNLDKFHTPLLMEMMGYGTPYKSVAAPPESLSLKEEVFTGLNRLGDPVEMYYYPNEGHTPDHPQARLASLQRNVDWYRFWLQGYLRPGDPEKFARWSQMKRSQQPATRK
jgi:dipeptidyl aminopeptidase/acylaminoacyl peptidase